MATRINRHSRYDAIACHGGARRYVGSFDTREEAAEAAEIVRAEMAIAAQAAAEEAFARSSGPLPEPAWVAERRERERAREAVPAEQRAVKRIAMPRRPIIAHSRNTP